MQQMSNEHLIIMEGFDANELLTLKKELHEKQIDFDETNYVTDSSGKYNEFVGYTILAISITNAVIQIVRLWLSQQNKKKTKKERITLKLRDGISLTIEKDNNQNERLDEGLNQIANILDALSDVFESLET